MSLVDYRVRIWTPASSAVAYTIGSSQLRTTPAVGGQDIDPLRGRASARPWSVDIQDNGNYFSSKIADAGGRMQLLGRLLDAQASTDGGTSWVTLATGRVSDLADHVTHYRVTSQDERYKERNAIVFNSQQRPSTVASSSYYSGTAVFPAGVQDTYGPFQSRGGIPARLKTRTGTLRFMQFFDPKAPVSGDIAALVGLNQGLNKRVRADVKAGALVDSNASTGNFVTLRANIDGTDYPVASFDVSRDASLAGLGSLNLTNSIFSNPDGPIIGVGVWIVDPTTALSADATAMYLYMPTAPPSSDLPLHIGGATGIHPFQLVKDLYDAIGVKYSSSGMNDLLTDSRYGNARWRITGPQNLARWLEDHVYGPYGVVPFVNSSGEVSPRSVLLPQGLNYATLTQYTDGNAVVQPAWGQTGRDQVTAVVYHMTREDFWPSPYQADGAWPGDLIAPNEAIIEYDHDRLLSTQAPRLALDLALDGVHFTELTYGPNGLPQFLPNAFGTAYAKEIFDRYGDAPIRGTLTVLSSKGSTQVTTDAEGGDFRVIAINTFPSPQTGARGGLRLVQILSKTWKPGLVCEYDWIDCGAAAAALTAPVISLAQSASSPNHVLQATIPSAGALSSAGWDLQINYSTAAVTPSSSTAWVWALSGTSSGTFNIGPLQSGQKVWAQVRLRDYATVRSAWSVGVNSTTGQIAAPTLLASSSRAGGSVVLTFTPADNNYPIEIRGSSAALAELSSQRLGVLLPRSNVVRVGGLVAATTYNFGVRHIDQWGGRGAMASLTTETSALNLTCPAIAAIRIAMGTT